jgi:pimeloyl-ACP methyl ester carboxylesterase
MTQTAYADAVGSVQRFAGLTGVARGDDDGRPPLVLLHGLTFDRFMWRPAIDELGARDPGRRTLALDLPGHGGSDPRASYRTNEVVEHVRQAVEEAGLTKPVLVGHSISGMVATLYAARHAVSGVVNVDQTLYVAPFAEILQSLAGDIEGPGFAGVWQMLWASMQTELLPRAAQDLLRATSRPQQEVVVGYWREVLDRSVDELVSWAASELAAVRASAVPYLVVAGDELEPAYRRWLDDALPQASVTVLPRSGHFPHLAHPRRFAELLAATDAWSAAAARVR